MKSCESTFISTPSYFQFALLAKIFIDVQARQRWLTLKSHSIRFDNEYRGSIGQINRSFEKEMFRETDLKRSCIYLLESLYPNYSRCLIYSTAERVKIDDEGVRNIFSPNVNNICIVNFLGSMVLKIYFIKCR